MKNRYSLIFICFIIVSSVLFYIHSNYTISKDKKEAEKYSEWLVEEIVFPMTAVLEEMDKAHEEYVFEDGLEEILKASENISKTYSVLIEKAEKRKIESKELEAIHEKMLLYLETRRDNYQTWFQFYQDNDPEKYSLALKSTRESEKHYLEYEKALYKYLDNLEVDYEIPEHFY